MTVFIAKTSFAAEIDGVPHVVRKGITRVRAGHPLLKGREHLFEPADAHADYEQATKAPGEKRVRRTSKPKAKQPASPKAKPKSEATPKPASETKAETKPDGDDAASSE